MHSLQGILVNDLHPNIALLQQLKPGDITSAPEILADDVVFHYYNPKLPELHGDYVGASGIRSFFEKLALETKGTFRVNPVSATAEGDELVVMHTVNTLALGEDEFSVDVVLIWRIVDNRIKEIWDIPSLYTTHSGQGPD